ncbi:MAG TPA: choice-of-anchor J domain-containing protein [Flavobacteriaceae bacterium]|nr:choice-of-anchor J domain-containing protein [Flavobacteriaceae bacterium]
MKKTTFVLLFACIFTAWQSNAQFSEGFESGIPGTWTVINNGDPNGWEQNDAPSGGAQEGTSVAGIVYDSAIAHDDYLITPQIVVTAGVNDRLSYYIKSRSASFLEPFEVLLSTTGTSAGDFSVVLQASSDAPSTWTQNIFDLSAYDGQSVYVAIHATGLDEWELYVDNVVNDAFPTDTLDYFNLQWPASGAIDDGDTFNVYAQCYEAGVTDATASQVPGIECWIGYSTSDTSPDGAEWTWIPASFNNNAGNNDEYLLDLGTTIGSPGTYYYASRWSFNDGPYTYGGIQSDGSYGGEWGTDNNISGMLTINAAPGQVCETAIVIGTLPYSTTDDTANYGDEYENGDSPCSDYYMNGDDVVYSFTPTTTGSYNIALTNLGDTYSGIHVLDACPSDTPNCVGFEGNSGSDDRIFDVDLDSGTTYYIIISTWATPQSTSYTLDITENTCTDATVSYTVIEDCDNSGGFLVDVEITDMGTATDITLSDDQGSPTQPVTATGTYQFGPYTIGTDVVITVSDDNDVNCVQSSSALTLEACPPANDLLANAIALACDDDVTGTTLGATQDESDAPDVATVEPDTSADNDSPWVWYSYTGSGIEEEITLSTCGTDLTDFDTEIFVYTGTSGNLTLIDDGYDECGGSAENYAAETTFTSDGTTTYYIAVGGYNSDSVGNFRLAVSCVTLSVSDNQLNSFTYYPNPVKNTLHLNSQQVIEDVTVFNMLGQEVLKTKPDTSLSEVDLSSLTAGAYFVSVTVDGISETIRIVKQ